MENKKENNFAYIDGANLHRGTTSLGWKLDYKRFRVWLAEKYEIKTAYLFLGLVPKYKELYKYLQECGFILTYKQVSYDDVGTVKGNCDAILVLDAVSGFYEKKYDKAVIVSSDGDYASLVKFLKEREMLGVILSPHAKNLCSILLKRTAAPIAYINDQRSILEMQKEKAPDADGTA